MAISYTARSAASLDVSSAFKISTRYAFNIAAGFLVPVRNTLPYGGG